MYQGGFEFSTFFLTQTMTKNKRVNILKKKLFFFCLSFDSLTFWLSLYIILTLLLKVFDTFCICVLGLGLFVKKIFKLFRIIFFLIFVIFRAKNYRINELLLK